MNRKTCAIVDDCIEDCQILQTYLDQIPILKTIAVLHTYSEALSFLMTHNVDILFMDIALSDPNGRSGFDIIKTLPVVSEVIIISSNLNNAVESYNVGSPADFILKPYSFQRLQLSLNRFISKSIIKSHNSIDYSIYLKAGRKFQRFDTREINYVEAYGLYVKLYTGAENKITVINERLGNMVPMLGSDFIRVHKSFVINLNKVSEFDINNLFVNGRPIPIGRTYRESLNQFLQLFGELN